MSACGFLHLLRYPGDRVWLAPCELPATAWHTQDEHGIMPGDPTKASGKEQTQVALPGERMEAGQPRTATDWVPKCIPLMIFLQECQTELFKLYVLQAWKIIT